MTRIACIGEAMIELSMDGATAQVGVAGDTLNTAIYMRRSAPALSVDYMTCLGDEPFSEQVADFIAAQGVGTSAITRLPDMSPGLYAITTTPEGERSFSYWRSDSAARRLFADHDFSALAAYDALYISGISIAILPQEVRWKLLEWLASSSVTLIYDSNYRPRLWESADVAREITSAFWQRADIMLPSIDDEMELYEQSAAQVEQRFKSLSGKGALKRGAEGPLSLGESISQSYAPAEKVIDTTAAGDSFNGGYIATLLSGGTQADALLAGHNLAARVVQYRGAIILE